MPHNQVRQFVTESGLRQVPFNFELQAVPIVQNEDRAMCNHRLFLNEDFIQNRFITGKNGRRFSFDEEILVAFAHDKQRVLFKPEKDMILKVSTKQAYGINMNMRLCSADGCHVASSQTGNSELLFGQLDAGKDYYLELEHRHSIIMLSSFFDCPHVRLRISMMSENEA